LLGYPIRMPTLRECPTDIRVVSAKRREREKMCPRLGGRSPLT
jgi:hypothetical protein